MRALQILQDKLEPSLAFMHAKRRAALWRVVAGLLAGQQLWLTELGRNLPGVCLIKHRVKAVDRFVGSAAMQGAVAKIYAAVANLLMQSLERPIVLVDWTGAESGLWVLSAKVAFRGRALTILSRTYREKKKSNPKVERAFLNELKTIIPASCRPVLVTDAGFMFTWVDSLRRFGWDYVGRARFKKMIVNIGGQCMRLHEVYGLAKRKPRDLGTAFLGKSNPRTHRVILSARPKRKGRKSLTLKGNRRMSGVARTCEAGAREPLLLITSLPDPPAVVLDIYRTRMQIEQTFRDLKSHRYGWSTRHIRSHQTRRVDVLFLVGALAALAMHLIGLAVRGSVLARGLQANTERRRPVFSTFFLGRLVLNEGLAETLQARTICNALRELIALVAAVERRPA